MIDVRAHLARKPLLFDGGMGTYYKAKPGTECEQGNLLDPAGVRKVHREYLAAGAEAIKTNTFGLPRMAAARQPDWQALARAGWKLAAEAAAETGAAVFADLGPAPDTEALGLEISLKMAREALPYADGFYLMTPFNRVALMERLIARLKTELLQEQ